MLRVHTFAFLSTISVIAFAADDQPIRAPYIEVGDCWSYRAENFQNRGPIDNFDMCVTFIDREKDAVMTVTTVKSDGRELEGTFSSDWGFVRSIVGRVYRPAARFIKFPLRLGEVYSVEFEYADTLAGSNTGKEKYEMRVVGWEEISVPAGTFRSVKIEGGGAGTRYDRRATYNIGVTIWYAPEVNRFLKYQWSFPTWKESAELTGFRLNK